MENISKREIGSARDLIKFIFHVEGSPVEQAEAIKELLDMGYTQKDIAKMLGWSRARVNQRLAYLKLIPELREKAKRGEISKYTAWHLAHLPEEKQREFINQKKITLKDAEKTRRRQYVPENEETRLLDILELDLESKSEKTDPYKKIYNIIMKYRDQLPKQFLNEIMPIIKGEINANI